MSRRSLVRIAVLVVFAAAIGMFFALGLERHFTLAILQANEHRLLAIKNHDPALAAGAFVLVYVAMATLSMPGDLLLELAAGAVFGLAEGTVLVSFASSLGATAALLFARFVLRDAVRRRFPARLAQIDGGLKRSGGTYLLSLRLLPAVPFVLTNMLFGVTGFPARRFYWISQVGMLPGAIVCVNAGRELEKIRSFVDILSAPVLVSLLLLAAGPLAVHAATAGLTRNR